MPYSTVVQQDEISDSGARCYVAYHPELPGCMAQGETIIEAQHELDEVRALYLAHLAEHNLPVPLPFDARPGTMGAMLTLVLSVGG